ncbi:phage holin, partial [Bifidobacterium longum]|uniref:phage holin n=1 Tax=Bifidobacterium longum TaxID=216816 RepID=UPI00355B5AA7
PDTHDLIISHENKLKQIINLAGYNPAWGWTHVDAIVTTLNALGILAGALIGVSAIKQRLDLAA